jgi:hypothetical protein
MNTRILIYHEGHTDVLQFILFPNHGKLLETPDISL